VLAIGGGVLVLALALLVAWGLRATRAASAAAISPALVAYLEQRDRELWRAVAEVSRRSLPSGDRGQVTIYADKTQR
jgi:hypothetical protein